MKTGTVWSVYSLNNHVALNDYSTSSLDRSKSTFGFNIAIIKVFDCIELTFDNNNDTIKADQIVSFGTIMRLK